MNQENTSTYYVWCKQYPHRHKVFEALYGLKFDEAICLDSLNTIRTPTSFHCCTTMHIGIYNVNITHRNCIIGFRDTQDIFDQAGCNPSCFHKLLMSKGNSCDIYHDTRLEDNQLLTRDNYHYFMFQIGDTVYLDCPICYSKYRIKKDLIKNLCSLHCYVAGLESDIFDANIFTLIKEYLIL